MYLSSNKSTSDINALAPQAAHYVRLENLKTLAVCKIDLGTDLLTLVMPYQHAKTAETPSSCREVHTFNASGTYLKSLSLPLSLATSEYYSKLQAQELFRCASVAFNEGRAVRFDTSAHHAHPLLLSNAALMLGGMVEVRAEDFEKAFSAWSWEPAARESAYLESPSSCFAASRFHATHAGMKYSRASAADMERVFENLPLQPIFDKLTTRYLVEEFFRTNSTKVSALHSACKLVQKDIWARPLAFQGYRQISRFSQYPNYMLEATELAKTGGFRAEQLEFSACGLCTLAQHQEHLGTAAAREILRHISEQAFPLGNSLANKVIKTIQAVAPNQGVAETAIRIAGDSLAGENLHRSHRWAQHYYLVFRSARAQASVARMYAALARAYENIPYNHKALESVLENVRSSKKVDLFARAQLASAAQFIGDWSTASSSLESVISRAGPSSVAALLLAAELQARGFPDDKQFDFTCERLLRLQQYTSASLNTLEQNLRRENYPFYAKKIGLLKNKIHLEKAQYGRNWI